jgi:hypothetical protein
MSNSFISLFLASLSGIAAFYLLEAVYYEIKARINGKRFENFLEYLEEEYED